MGPFAIFSLILIGVYWVGRAIGLFDQLIGDGQPLGVFLEIMALFLPQVVAIVLPVVSFAAALFVSNRMHSESEMVVLQSSGLSPFRLLRPFLIFSVLVMLLASVLSHVLVPLSLVQLERRQFELQQDLGTRLIVAGRFLHPTDDVAFFVSKVDHDGSLIDIFLHDKRPTGRDLTYTAHKAVLVRTDTGSRLVMYEGAIQALDRRTQQLSKIQFDEFLFDIGTLTGARDNRPRSYQEFSTLELLYPTARTEVQTASTSAELRMVAFQRVEQPLQSLVYPLIGMAFLMTGSFSRFGVARQVLGAVGIVILLSSLSVVLRDVARADITRWPLLYFPDFLGVLIVAALLKSKDRRSRRKRPGPPSAAQGAA